MTAVPNEKKLTVEEYYKLTENMEERTELINGQIVAMASPSRTHQRIAYRMHSIIDSFIRSNNGSCEVNGEIDVRLNKDVIVVPDVSVICDPSKLDERGCNGAPDWVIEVTSSNRADDFSRKLNLYKKSGVREYWIVDTDERKVYVYDFEQHPNVVEFYDWTDEIPVSIYGGALKIRIEDLI